ncbi:MAG: SDR family NAD(P)-dependent oxidoreductase [Candidatus Kariarchaeaceae archaeon]|jgi:short-subunit dehydrogenase
MEAWALVTGASSGLGREYARQLAAEGYHLIITARREELLNELADEIRSNHSLEVQVVPGDLTLPAFRTELASLIAQQKGFAYLVNNAGLGIPRQFLEVEAKDHLVMTALHVEAVIELSHAAMKVFSHNNRGTIITVSSVAAFTSTGIYTGTKFFQVAFTRRLARYIRKEGWEISVQAVCPGFTKTEFHFAQYYRGKEGREMAPSWLWLEASEVVGVSIAAAKKKRVVVIPSIKYKIFVFLARVGIIRR